jgi:hypothetical protein
MVQYLQLPIYTYNYCSVQFKVNAVELRT